MSVSVLGLAAAWVRHASYDRYDNTGETYRLGNEASATLARVAILSATPHYVAAGAPHPAAVRRVAGTLRAVAAEEGVRGLARGLSTRLTYNALFTAVGLAAFEAAKRHLVASRATARAVKGAPDAEHQRPTAAPR